MSFFVTGGTLQFDAPSYVERRADRELFEGLLQGEFCYVLTARQMGKSSLMVRTANRLRSSGVHVAAIDLTALGGQNITPFQWYFGLLDTLGQELGLQDELERFWQENEESGPLHRFMKSIRHVVLPELARRRSAEMTGDIASGTPSKVQLVVFVDEIDFVRSLPFSTDEFFAAVRECYNRRTLDPIFEQVTFCLLGVASPSDLIQDTRTTPFNIGRRIELNDFTPDESMPLALGLKDANPEYRFAGPLLERILYWTEGHPYLSQRLCLATAEALRTKGRAGAANSPAALVDGLCADLFFSDRSRERDDNLIFVRERLWNEPDRAALLDLYSKVLRGKRIMDDELDPIIGVLRLSGVVRVSGGRLRERNRIYERVFDREWIRSSMPEAELRRQRQAYRRGVIWAASVSAVIVLALVLLSLFAASKAYEANLAEAKARSSSGRLGQRNEALKAIDRARWWGLFSGNLAELRNEAIAALNLVDLEDGPAIVGSDGDTTAPELNPAFSHYAAADRNGRIRIVNLESKAVEQWKPMDLSVRWLRFDSSGEYLGVGCVDPRNNEWRFVLYRVEDGTEVVNLMKAIGRDAWDISRTGERLAVGLDLQHIQHYSLPGGALFKEPVSAQSQTEGRRISCVRFDSSGKRLAVGSPASGHLYVWDLAKDEFESYLHRDGIVDVDWHPGGRQLATACQNGDIYLLDLESRVAERLFDTSSALIDKSSSPAALIPPDVCFNSMGTVLAAVCSDLSLRLWRPQNRRQILASFELGIDQNVRLPAGLRFNKDDRALSLNIGNRTARQLLVHGGRELVTLQGKSDTTEALQCIGFDPGGNVLMAAGFPGRVKSWDLRTARELDTVNVSYPISAIGFVRDGTTLLASTSGGFFQLPFRSIFHSGAEELRIGPAECLFIRAGLGRFALTTNGIAAVIRAGVHADTIHLWNLRDPVAEPRRVAAGRKLNEIAITPDGRWLFASGSPEPEILAWDLFKDDVRTPSRTLPGSRYLSLCPSGRWLATVWRGEFRLWRVGSWGDPELSIPLLQKFEGFAPIAFAPSPGSGECLLAAAISPTTVELFRFIDGKTPALKKLARLESPDPLPIESLALDPVFGRLAAGSKDQIVQVWNLAQIREELHQRGLDSDFPGFRTEPSGGIRLVVEPALNEADKEEAALQKARFTQIDILTDKIESEETNAPDPGLVLDLVTRGRAYRDVLHFSAALSDFQKASRIEQALEVEARRRATGAAPAAESGRGGKSESIYEFIQP